MIPPINFIIYSFFISLILLLYLFFSKSQQNNFFNKIKNGKIFLIFENYNTSNKKKDVLNNNLYEVKYEKHIFTCI